MRKYQGKCDEKAKSDADTKLGGTWQFEEEEEDNLPF